MKSDVNEKSTPRTYIAIDLKSFYASVECKERGLDPLNTNLVVADVSRTEKTICLAVSPSLKAYGIPGRARLFEVIQKLREVNARRKTLAPGQRLEGSSWDAGALRQYPNLEVDYLAVPPRMSLYVTYSTRIYEVYLKYIAPEDIHVYSIDEVMMDVTDYLATYRMTAEELARKMILDVQETVGITATAGIGTNLYLCKVAMDIVSKHIPPDENGVRIATLDEGSYRRLLWDHRPLRDFWRVGKGYETKLEAHGLYTMGDIARCSIGKPEEYYNEELLYRLFGVNAELLIDHACGWEPCTIADIQAYEPENKSTVSGQVLACAYGWEKARLVLKEMADQLGLDLVAKGLVTDQLVLHVGYDIDNLKNEEPGAGFQGETKTDRYGRRVPKPAHGTENLGEPTASSRLLREHAMALYDRIVDKSLLIRRLSLEAGHLISKEKAEKPEEFHQMNLFADYHIEEAGKESTGAENVKQLENQKKKEQKMTEKERKLQEAMLDIRKKFGKNAVLKGMDLEEGATARERNTQIGGHKA